MRSLATSALTLAFVLFTPISWAEAQMSAPPSGQNTPPDHGPDSGTSPGGRGSSGWTGGNRTGADDHNTGHQQSANINADSEYATGSDLNGPPARFPANRTPE